MTDESAAWDTRPRTVEALSVALGELLPHVERAAAHARRRQELRAADGRRLSRRHVEALVELERRLTGLSDAITDLLDADHAPAAAAGASAEPEPAPVGWTLPPDVV